MKWTTMARALWFLAALQILGLAPSAANPNGIDGQGLSERTYITCRTVPEKKPCTEADVKAINDAKESYKGKRKEAVEHIRRITLLNRRRGTLKCERLDGRPCTQAQLLGLADLAGKARVIISIEEGSKSFNDEWTDQQ